MRSRRTSFLALVPMLLMGLAACDSDTAIDAMLTGPVLEHATVEGESLAELERGNRLRRGDAGSAIRILLDEYPDALRRVGQKRMVSLGVFVDGTGRVADTRLQESSGSAAVDAVAMRAARELRFIWGPSEDPADGAWVEDVRLFWPLIVVDDVPRPEIALDALEEEVEIRHLDIVKGDRHRFGEWAPGGIIRVTTGVGAAASG